MAKSGRPEQVGDLLGKIQVCIKTRKYRLSKHAIERQVQRKITLPDVLHVLSKGFHEKKKTSFDDAYKVWKYAIRGKTVDHLDVRIIITFADEMIIITVMQVTRGAL
jgi:hypothetical protein